MGIYTSVLKQPEPQANHTPQCNTEQGHAHLKLTRKFSSYEKAACFTLIHRTQNIRIMSLGQKRLVSKWGIK